MSLLNRSPINIGRGARQLRDDRVFVVATDDTYAPLQYFEFLPLPRVKVTVVPTPLQTTASSPGHVVQRLKDAFDSVKERGQVQQGDEFWVFLDKDRNMRDNNIVGTLEALRTARHSGFEIAISSPCFELWLLLHHEDVPANTTFTVCADVEQKLKAVLGGYNKTKLRRGQFQIAHLPDAIRRARALESSPDDPDGHWPENVGTRVYRLLERVLPKTS